MAVHTTSLLGLLAPITVVLALLAGPAGVLATNGQATYYDTLTPSACYGNDTGPFGPEPYLVAAVSPGLFNNHAGCGALYQVTCLGCADGSHGGCIYPHSVTVKVVDLCSGCSEPGLQLSRGAFSTIAHPDVSRIIVDIEQV